MNGFKSSKWLNSSIWPIDRTLTGITTLTSKSKPFIMVSFTNFRKFFPPSDLALPCKISSLVWNISKMKTQRFKHKKCFTFDICFIHLFRLDFLQEQVLIWQKHSYFYFLYENAVSTYSIYRNHLAFIVCVTCCFLYIMFLTKSAEQGWRTNTRKSSLYILSISVRACTHTRTQYYLNPNLRSKEKKPYDLPPLIFKN